MTVRCHGSPGGYEAPAASAKREKAPCPFRGIIRRTGEAVSRARRHMGRHKSGDLKKFLISHEIRNFLVKSAGF